MLFGFEGGKATGRKMVQEGNRRWLDSTVLMHRRVVGLRQHVAALARDGGTIVARHEQEDEVQRAKLGRLGCLANLGHEEKKWAGRKMVWAFRARLA
jgi:hypothetical protein